MNTHMVRTELLLRSTCPEGTGGTRDRPPLSAADGQWWLRSTLAFRLQDLCAERLSQQGRTAAAIINGYASLVFYRDGTATVGKWGRDVSATRTS